MVLVERAKHGFAIGDGMDLIPIMLKLRLEHAAKVVLVVCDQNLPGFGHGRSVAPPGPM